MAALPRTCHNPAHSTIAMDPMRTLRQSIVKLLVVLACACSHNEPSTKPLGLGPLSLAERKAVEERSTADRYSRSRQDAEDRAHAEVERATEKSAAAAPSSSSSASAASGSGPNDAGKEASKAANKDAGAAATAVTEHDWVGTYQGSDVTLYVMEGQPDRRFDDPKAKIRVERRAPQKIALVFVDSSNGQDLCSLESSVAGNEAKVLPGQRCFIEPDDEMQVKSRPGTAVRDGTKLTVHVILDTTLDVDDVHAEGRIEYEFNGNSL